MDTFALFANTFDQVITGGIDRIMPYVMYGVAGMMALGIMWACLSIAVGNGSTVHGAAHLAIRSGFYLALIQHVQPLTSGIITGAVQFGLLAGGSGLNSDVFMRSPDSIFTIGYARSLELWELAHNSCQSIVLGGCLSQLEIWGPIYASAWIVFGTFAIIAVVVFATFMILWLAILSGIILLPVAIFAPTSHFGWNVIRAAAHSAVQIMVLAVVVAVANTTFGKLLVHATPGELAGTPFILASLLLLVSAGGAMALAGVLTSGALVSAGNLVGAPVGLAVAGSRSIAGHLDAPVSAMTKGGGEATYAALRAATNPVTSRVATAASSTFSRMRAAVGR